MLGDAFNGVFEPWLGRAPVPEGLTTRARGWLLDVAVVAYHRNFAGQCRTAPGPWLELTRRVESQSYNRFGPIGPPIVVEQTSVVREAFRHALDVRVNQQRGGMDDFTDGIRSLIFNNALRGNVKRLLGSPNQAWFEKDFQLFIQTHGCTSDPTRQLEVNLHLLADGFPPLQQVLGKSL